jgi:hypothetical protein
MAYAARSHGMSLEGVKYPDEHGYACIPYTVRTPVINLAPIPLFVKLTQYRRREIEGA